MAVPLEPENLKEATTAMAVPLEPENLKEATIAEMTISFHHENLK